MRFSALFSFLAILLFAVLLSCSSGEKAGTTETDAAAKTVIYLSRHAEKAAGEDPELLPAGSARADRLAAMVGSKLDAVYHTNYRRTKATAQPAAQRAQVEATAYDAGANAKTLTDGWVRKHRGKTILVVGHSNTVPALVNALLGEQKFQDIDHDEYGLLYKVTLKQRGKATVEELRTD